MGPLLVSEDVRLRAGAYPVEFVDGSGGGDAFDAGYVYGLLHGLGTEDCLRVASALGASCVRAIGTTTGRLHPGRVRGLLAAAHAEDRTHLTGAAVTDCS